MVHGDTLAVLVYQHRFKNARSNSIMHRSSLLFSSWGLALFICVRVYICKKKNEYILRGGQK